MISLVRRQERRQRMLHCLDALGFDYMVFDAVDGKWAKMGWNWKACLFSLSVSADHGVLVQEFEWNVPGPDGHPLPSRMEGPLGRKVSAFHRTWLPRCRQWKRPVTSLCLSVAATRPMTYGEVGCFLSHYFIWLKVIYSATLVIWISWDQAKMFG